MKVADQFVKMLEEAGVKHFYAITGDSLNHVNHAIKKSEKLKWIHVRHEETGAYAASAEAQLTGRLACCAGSSGPGHVHLINGLYDANRSYAPVLALASTEVSAMAGTSFFQETEPLKLFEDCSVYNEIANTPEQAFRMMRSAMLAASGKNGVAVVGLPGDVSSQDAFPTEILPIQRIDNETVIPAQPDIDLLAEKLNESKKITLFCGAGCHNAGDELFQLSALLQAPIVSSFKGKMQVMDGQPNVVGITALLGVPSANNAVFEADVLLMLGTDFPYSWFLPEKTWTAQIDIRPENIGRRTNVHLSLHGDVKQTLKLLLPKLEKKADNGFLTQKTNQYQTVLKHLARQASNQGKEYYISPEYVTTVIDRQADKNAVFTIDTGMNCVWAARYLTSFRTRSMIGSFNHGSMGNALPHAIGAALACPDRQVVCLCGDGGLSMALGELSTVMQYQLPIKIFVYNNRSLGMVKLEMEAEGLPDWQVDMQNPDFQKVAEANNVHAITVTHPEYVADAVAEAFAYNGPVLVNLHTDANALILPARTEVKQMMGFIHSMYRKLLDGNFEEVKSQIGNVMVDI